MKTVKVITFAAGRALCGCQVVVDVDVKGWEKEFDGIDGIVDDICKLTDERNVSVGSFDELDWIVWVGGDERNVEGRDVLVKVITEWYGVDTGVLFGKLFDVVVSGKKGERYFV